MSKLTVLVATTNAGKVREIQSLLQSRYVEVVTLHSFPHLLDFEVEETGTTFKENAELKARTYGRMSGLLTLADDSGLSVDALDGRPGVYSKRYGSTDAERISKLLVELEDKQNRSAHFTCAIALYDPSSDKTRLIEGRADGSITSEPKGTNGFGFDPIFYSPELNCTFAEASSEQKNQVSHRAKALEKAIKFIQKRTR